MRTRERKRPDRGWMPWSATGLAAGRSPSIKQQPLVEGLERRNLLSHFQAGSPDVHIDTTTNHLIVNATVAGLGNSNLQTTVTATARVTVLCHNPGENNKVVESHTQLIPVTLDQTTTEPKNGKATVNLDISLLLTDHPNLVDQVEAAATCPNPNWTTEAVVEGVVLQNPQVNFTVLSTPPEDLGTFTPT